MAKAKNVTVIPATFNPQTRKPVNQLSRRKVAGYARVSTDSDEQFTSYEAQVDYYTNYIKANPEWEFVTVYTDEGISGTNTRHRTGFNEMVSDALAGKIDLIITKSVSRFARNTVDSLSTIRKLKENGTEVYFEKEQIWTFDSKGELLLTIMSSLAQEESRSISENVTWGKRKQFSDGKYSIAYSQFLGYRKGADGQMEIVPEQAKIVKRIYRMFLEGSSPSRIAKTLTKEGIPTPAGKSVWQTRVVESILTNEKYKGDARLQKKFTTDFLTKATKVNEGEVPQYYVTASHPEIIDPEEWDRVEKELHRRKINSKGRFTGSVFSRKIVCGDCGEAYGRKVWHSNDPYRKVIWQCNAKFKGKDKKCSTPHLTEEQIKDAYVTALSLLIVDREQFIEDGRLLKAELTDTADIKKQLDEATQEMEVIAGLIKQCIDDNASCAIDQTEYNSRYNSLVDRYEKQKERIERLQTEKNDRDLKAEVLSGFLFEIMELPDMDLVFNENRFGKTVDNITVFNNGRLIFTFFVGKDITVEI
ncbi:MAG: recombinase family protein [Clostridium sp.]|nr:recombinase family protein [Clostridium sp.]